MAFAQISRTYSGSSRRGRIRPLPHTPPPPPSPLWIGLSSLDCTVYKWRFVVLFVFVAYCYLIDPPFCCSKRLYDQSFFSFTEYHPINTTLVTNLTNSTAIVDMSFTLTCSALANPPARYQLNREQEFLNVSSTGSSSYTFTTSVTERVNQVTYSCLPFNDYGHGSTTTRTVTVICK